METKTENKSSGSVVVRGSDMPISTKKSIVICKLLKGKKIDSAIKLLESVANEKFGIKMNRKETLKPGKGTKYPIKTVEAFIKLLNSLNANASYKNLDVGKIILSAKANQASRPLKAGARYRQFKRTHVEIIGKVVEDKK